MDKIEELGVLLITIYECGDQDECSMKHIENGLCILYTGKNPSNQELYVDYSSAGWSEEEYQKFLADDTYEPVNSFRDDVWQRVYNIYNTLSAEDKELFFELAHPYGDIEDSSWMEFYD